MKKKFIKILIYSILIFYALITLYPFIWTVASSFKPYAEIVSGTFKILPEDFTLESYEYLFSKNENFIQWIKNSLFICIVGTTLNIFLNTMAGYSLARIHFRGRNFIFYMILATIMVPAQVLMIPNYLVIKNLGLLNTYAAVILPSAVNATYIFMMRQFFINFPKEVEEAGQIDGLGRMGLFFRIAMPLARTAIATQAIFIFLGLWNEFLKPKMYLTDPSMYTLTIGIQSLTSGSDNATQWDLVLAASVISLVPILIMYIIFNKYFLVGIRMDGEK